MARMKGLSEWRIVIRHAARNALLPVRDRLRARRRPVDRRQRRDRDGVQLARHRPAAGPGGLGRSDYPLAQGAFLMIALVLVAMNFVADLLYMVLDPRVSPWPTTAEAPSSPRPRAGRGSPRAAAHGGDAARATRSPSRASRSMSLFVLVALFADQLATHRSDSRSCSPRPASSPPTAPPGRRVPARHDQSRPRHLLPARLRHAQRAGGRPVGRRHRRHGRHPRRPGLGLFRRLGRRRADAARRHGAQPSRSCPSSSCSTGFLRRRAPANIVLAVALLLWPNTARVIRSQVLTVRERAYVEAARVTGASRLAHPVRACRAQHPAALLPLRLDRHRLGDPDRGERQLPGLRRSDAACRGAIMLQDAFVLAGAVARQLRTGSCRRASASSWSWSPGFFISRGYEEVLLAEAAELTRWRSSTSMRCSPLPHPRAARVRAVDGASFDVPDGAHRRPGRRIGLRQDHGWCAPSSACWPRTRGSRRRPHRLQGPAIDGAADPSASAALARHRLSCRKAP